MTTVDPAATHVSGSPTLLFVTGIHRSGTSIVHRCLRDHPLFSGFQGTGVPEDEGQHLQSVVPPAWRYGGPGRFGFQPGSRLTESSPLATDANRVRLWSEWSRYWQLDRPVLVEKSPPTLLRTRFFQALFPRSQFLVVTRHPVAVAYATRAYTRRRWRFWHRVSIASQLEHWAHCHRIFAEDRPSLARVMVLKHEDFTADPARHMAGICAFVGVPASEMTTSVRHGQNAKYFEEWRRDLRSPRFRRRVVRIVERLEPEFSAFGYSLAEAM